MKKLKFNLRKIKFQSNEWKYDVGGKKEEEEPLGPVYYTFRPTLH
jgi:hypothetical protein